MTTRRYDRLLSWTLTHPWALTREMMGVAATILARHVAGEPRALDGSFLPAPTVESSYGNGVMVIPIHGVLAPRITLMSDISGGATFEEAGTLLDEAVANRDVGTIILDWDSPGGSVAGAFEFAQKVLAARQVKPVYSHANFQMCSAAYWTGACATEVIASPSACLGSIGVYCIHEDLSRALDELGVKITYVSAGKFKVDGNETEPLTDTARARMQAMVDTHYGRFVKHVAEGRHVSADAVRTGMGEGAVVTADDAMALGMIDRVETLEETVGRVRTARASVSAARAAVVTSFERELVALSF